MKMHIERAMGRSSRRITMGGKDHSSWAVLALLLVGGLGLSGIGVGEAWSATLFEADFDEHTSAFQTAVDESWPAAGEPVWTAAPPAGWRIGNFRMPARHGVTEWQGWSFTTLRFWSTVAGDQERSAFKRAKGVIAVADPDEWDDKNTPSSTGAFDSVLVSPPITVGAGQTTYLLFDSHYRQEGPQTAQVRVSFNGEKDRVLLHYDGKTGSDNNGQDVQNERIALTIPAPPTTSTMIVKWHLFNARNNWYWAIDNVRVTDTAPPPPPAPPGAFISLGPYLQFTASDKAMLVWETKAPAASILEYGATDPPLIRVTDPAPKTRHQLILTGLKPETPFYCCIKISSGSMESASRIYAFDTAFNYAAAPRPETASPYPEDERTALYAKAAERILAATNARQGYCLVWGCGEGRLAFELARRTDLKFICVDENADNVQAARRALRQAGLYGPRLAVHHGSLSKLPYADQFANLIVSDPLIAGGAIAGSAAEMYRVLRPCGGAVYLGQPSGAPNPLDRAGLETWLKAGFPKWSVAEDNKSLWISASRGPLAGSGDWSHQYADTANTACSGDQLVGDDLDVRWFGRPGAGPMVDRDCRMPAPLSVNGLLFAQGYDRLFAQDSYNGTILWTLEVPRLRRVNMPRDCSNMATDGEHLFLAVKDKCWVLDGATGERVRTFSVSATPDEANRDWGYVACVDDLLYGSGVKKDSFYTAIEHGEWYDGWGWEGHKVTSAYLFALDKVAGTRRWTYAGGAIINPTITIGDGSVYFVESRNPQALAQKTGRIGIPELWQDQFIVKMDAKTGQRIWERSVAFGNCNVVFYLSYADDTILVCGSQSSDRKYHVYGFDARDGNPLWDQHYAWSAGDHGKQLQHPVIVGDTVYVEPCAMKLKTGEIVRTDMPRRVKCGTISASATMLFYRNYDNGRWDLVRDVRSEWPGIRTGCWLNMIPAGGLLLAPEASSGCTCPFPIQTTLAYGPQ